MPLCFLLSVPGHEPPEVIDGLCTLRDALRGRRDVSLMWQPAPGAKFRDDDSPSSSFADHPAATLYARYLEDWLSVEPAGLALDLVTAVGDDRVRLYPQLSTDVTAAGWSVPLDGRVHVRRRRRRQCCHRGEPRLRC
jgi:hypothetical protein